jgi:hypothetical protein
MKYRLSLSTLPSPGEDLSHYQKVSLGGHNEQHLSPDRRFIKKVIKPNFMAKWADENGHIHERPMSKKAYMLREGKREEIGSKIAKIGNFTVPETVLHSHDPEKHVTLVSHYLQHSCPIYRHEDYNQDTDQKYVESISKILRGLDEHSVVGTAIFNYLINHRDTNLSNYLIHDRKLVPIDYGSSFLEGHDERQILKAPDIITNYFLKPQRSKKLDKNYLEHYVKNKNKLDDMVREHIAPLYTNDWEKKQVISDFNDRLNKLEGIHKKENPVYHDLIQVLDPMEGNTELAPDKTNVIEPPAPEKTQQIR